MPKDFDELLEGTIAHLGSLRTAVTRFISVRAEPLEALRQAPHSPSPARASDHSEINGINHVPSEPGPLPDEMANVPDKKSADMAHLRTRALACIQCPNLASSRKNVVFGVGNIHSPLMFVGEAPGADEDTQGEPFVGKAGQLLTRIIQTMGFSRDSVYIANILKCRPDTPGQTSGNRHPTPQEIQTCLPYLLAQIDIIKPRVIVALGGTAIEGLFGTGDGISRKRGNWLTFRDVPVMPTYHPAYLLRNQALSEKRKVWEDMLKVLEKLELPITDKQRGYFLKP